MSCTHTYAILEISKPAFEEIKGLLTKVNYEHAFDDHSGRLVIDMHGIAVAVKEEKCEKCGGKMLFRSEGGHDWDECEKCGHRT